MARREIAGLRTVLTGASSGIGRALARELGRHGARLVLTARREAQLAQLAEEIRAAGGVGYYVAGDLTDAAVRRQVLTAAESHLGGLDLLVNNAGVGALGPFAEADAERLRRIMEVNFFAPAELMRAAIPLLRAGRRPLIVNVSSVLAHRAVPGKSEYCASKFALHGLSDAVRCELAPLGINVLLVSPSTTRTEFTENVLEKAADVYVPPWGAMSAEAVARRTLHAIRRGDHEVILSLGGKLLVWLDRLCPPLANRVIARFARG
jgi:short-subunit dehydrogenase